MLKGPKRSIVVVLLLLLLGVEKCSKWNKKYSRTKFVSKANKKVQMKKKSSRAKLVPNQTSNFTKGNKDVHE